MTSSEVGPMRVVLVSDSFLIGDGLVALLAGIPEVQVVGRTANLDELPRLADDLGPGAAVIAVRSQVVTTTAIVAAARRMRFRYPAMRIVVISDRSETFTPELLRDPSAGITFLLDGYLPSIDSVVDALRQVGPSATDSGVVEPFLRRAERIGIDDLTPGSSTSWSRLLTAWATVESQSCCTSR